MTYHIPKIPVSGVTRAPRYDRNVAFEQRHHQPEQENTQELCLPPGSGAHLHAKQCFPSQPLLQILPREVTTSCRSPNSSLIKMFLALPLLFWVSDIFGQLVRKSEGDGLPFLLTHFPDCAEVCWSGPHTLTASLCSPEARFPGDCFPYEIW